MDLHYYTIAGIVPSYILATSESWTVNIRSGREKLSWVVFYHACHSYIGDHGILKCIFSLGHFKSLCTGIVYFLGKFHIELIFSQKWRTLSWLCHMIPCIIWTFTICFYFFLLTLALNFIDRELLYSY